MKIYTKTGDRGQTLLANGERTSKTAVVLDAFGSLDELNSAIGLTRELIHERSDNKDRLDNVLVKLKRLQAELFELGAEIAKYKAAKPSLTGIDVERLEAEIDEFSEHLPPLRSFILPGGGVIAANLHLCRTLCRRAERFIYRVNSQDALRSDLLCYINRLSDWLFVAARYVAAVSGEDELQWSPK